MPLSNSITQTIEKVELEHNLQAQIDEAHAKAEQCEAKGDLAGAFAWERKINAAYEKLVEVQGH